MFARPDVRLGVFETLLVVRGRPIELEGHLERLGQSLQALYRIGLPASARDLTVDLAQGVDLGRLRLSISSSGEIETRLQPIDWAAVFPTWSEAIELSPLLTPGGLGEHKWVDRAHVAAAEAAGGALAVPLLVDNDDEALEGSRGNLFALFGSDLCTPPLDGRILPGVTRHRLLEAARAAELVVVERSIGLNELKEADEVFLTGSVRGIEPVRAIAGSQLPRGVMADRLGPELQRVWAIATTGSTASGSEPARA